MVGASYHQHCQNEHPENNYKKHNYENATVLNRYQTMFVLIFQTFFDRHTWITTRHASQMFNTWTCKDLTIYVLRLSMSLSNCTDFSTHFHYCQSHHYLLKFPLSNQAHTLQSYFYLCHLTQDLPSQGGLLVDFKMYTM